MRDNARDPAAPARANRASEVFIAANNSEFTKNALSFQQNWLRNRFGIAPSLAALIAEHAFHNQEARA